jgi:hypothetical protein
MQRKAAEEFFGRNSCPQTQFSVLEPWKAGNNTVTPEAVPARTSKQMQGPSLPPTGSALSIEESKEIFRRLASGEIQQRRR